jgi:Putative DNA-binding domain
VNSLQRRRRAVLLFAGLFASAALTQLGVGWYQRLTTARNDLRQEADEVLRELSYSDRWDLTRFRQADLSVNRYFVLDQSGLVIEIEKFLPELEFRADLAAWEPGLRTVTVPATNETWRVLVIPVASGRVILGYSSPEDINRVDERLRENSKYFGRSIESALQTRISDTDRYLEYAILDESGHVKFALGGIPLKLVEYPRFPLHEIEELRTGKTETYGFLCVPVTNASGHAVGSVTVVDQLPPPPWLSLRAWLMNLSASLALALAGTALGFRYVREEFRPEELLDHALARGESSTVEFKESLRWDRWQVDQDDSSGSHKSSELKSIAEASAVARVAGFLNSRNGGTLIIGIADDKRLVGLDQDFESLVKSRENRGGPGKDRDRFQLHLRNLLTAKIGRDISNLCVETAIVSRDARDMCVIHANPSPTPVYIAEANRKSFYLRVGASTVALEVDEAVAYCHERWPRGFWARTRRFTRGR